MVNVNTNWLPGETSMNAFSLLRVNLKNWLTSILPCAPCGGLAAPDIPPGYIAQRPVTVTKPVFVKLSLGRAFTDTPNGLSPLAENNIELGETTAVPQVSSAANDTTTRVAWFNVTEITPVNETTPVSPGPTLAVLDLKL